MLEGLHSAAAGMAAQQQRMDAVANDLANANTTGYKHQRVGFRDLVYDQTGRSSAQGVRTGSGAAAVDAGRAFAQGTLQRTDRPLDVAIQGEGFLRVRLPDGRDALTRDGGLHIDGNRRLTTSTGALVQPAITVPEGVGEDQVSIGPDGTVLAAGNRIGRLDVVTVRSQAGLLSIGNNAFVTTPASGAAVAAPRATTLTQGALESSNTDMAEAMVSMIESQRAYQLASKAISHGRRDDGHRQPGEALMAINGLPAVPATALPAAVRNGSDDDKQAYKAALGFEQILLNQLVGEMLPKGTLTEGPYAAPMQEAFTNGLIADGGIGLAAQLYPSLRKDSA